MANPSVDEVWADPDFQGLPSTEKQKVLSEIDPDFAGLPQEEQLKVVGGEASVVDPNAKFYEIEKQPGLMTGGLKERLLELGKKGLQNPNFVNNAYQGAQMLGEVTGRIGADVARGASTPGGILPDIGTIPARAVGFGASILSDPTTYVGMGVGGKAAKAAAGQVEKVIPGALKVLADVPEQATDILLKTKDLFKQATGSEKAIEGAVRNVQSTLKSVLAREGKEISEVEKKLRIYRTPDQLRDEIVAKNGVGGYEAKLRSMSPDELIAEYQTTKKFLKDAPTTAGYKIATFQALKEAMSGRVKNFNLVGDTSQGLLKTTAKEAAQEIKNIPGGELLRAVQAKYARARTTYDSLQNLLKDEGNAEQILSNVFKSSEPRYKTIRRGLAELEKMSGEPVLTKLFQEFAVKHLSKFVGKGNRAAIGGTMMASAPATMMLSPLAGAGQMAVGASIAASQSPAVLSRLARNVKPALNVAGIAAGGPLAALFSKVSSRIQPTSRQDQQ